MGHGCYQDVEGDATLVLVDAAGGLRVPDLVETRAVPMLKIICSFYTY